MGGPTGFAEDSLANRISGLAGEPAEDAFKRYMAGQGRELGRDYLQSGYERTDTNNGFLAALPLTERHRPDFIQLGGHWWEVQGCGRDQVVRFKKEKLEVLWKHYCDHGYSSRQVRYFIYDMANDRAFVMPIQMVLWAIHHPDSRYDEQLLDGRKAGWEVPLHLFERRLLTDALDYVRYLHKQAAKQVKQADDVAARATKRAMRAAGVTLDSADGDAA